MPAWIQRVDTKDSRRSRLFIATTSVLVMIAVIVYAISFLCRRHGAFVTGTDFVPHRCYLFSAIPAKNRKLVTFYRPMIWLSGGLVEAEYKEKVRRRAKITSDTPLYLTEFAEGSWPKEWVPDGL